MFGDSVYVHEICTVCVRVSACRGRFESLNYPFLESRRSRGGPFSSDGTNTGLSGGGGGSSRSGLGTSLLAGGRTGSSGSASSDAMKPPPGKTCSPAPRSVEVS